MGAWLREKLLDTGRALRFGLVGIASSAVYLLLFNLTAQPIGPLSALSAHVAALGCGIAVSYSGHHLYTFRRTGGHALYFSKFVITTAALFALTSGVAFAGDRWMGYPPAVISMINVVLYPALSYVIHSVWTFGDARKRPVVEA